MTASRLKASENILTQPTDTEDNCADEAAVRLSNAVETWEKIQDALAEENGLSILLVDGRQPPALWASNNNSVCRVMQSAPEQAKKCHLYCGKAFETAQTAKRAVEYRCHAGLHCVATPLAENPVRPLAAIVGRAFITIADYQKLLDRTLNGDLRDLPQTETFNSLRFAESGAEIQILAERLKNLSEAEIQSLTEFVAHTEPNPFAPVFDADKAENQINSIAVTAPPANGFDKAKVAETVEEKTTESASAEAEESAAAVEVETLEDFAAWRAFTEVLLDKSFKNACAETLRFLAARHSFSRLAWLERVDETFRAFIVAETLRGFEENLTLAAADARLHEAVLNETSLRVGESLAIEIFPLAVGNDVRAAIVVGDEIESNERRRRVARFARQIAVPLEVLRLREELARRAEIVRVVQDFSEKLSEAEEQAAGDTTVNLFDALLRTCTDLLRASRGSLLLFNEAEKRLKIQAAHGNFAESLLSATEAVGERIAEKVWREGKPLLVENVSAINLPPAPPERGYHSKSFIIFPLFVGNRAIGVLNVTDKIGKNRELQSYDMRDLELLEAIAPQLAIALDRATLQQKAGKFEKLSITDALTGLLNRRYLNERIAEEVARSNRDGAPMSFMMIDIDNFKQYNDRFGHQAGDEVLRITAQTLKATLRTEDVAARFGGEEFCLLLPNTTLSEARMIGERIRRRVENTEFPHRKVTISIGVAAHSSLHNSPREIIEAADKALYQAKRIGKNNVQLWLFGQTRR
jgi:diguanylate cyclase (GGDEF)-like protein